MAKNYKVRTQRKPEAREVIWVFAVLFLRRFLLISKGEANNLTSILKTSGVWGGREPRVQRGQTMDLWVWP